MSPLLQAALDIQTILDQEKWRFCIIGGLAVLRWGNPRFTQDVDVTILSGFGDEQRYVTALLASGLRPRIADAAAFALRNRVLLLETATGIGIDIALGGLPFEESAVDRSTDCEYAAGCVLRTCSAEDLMVMKLFAGRPIDLFDAEGVVKKMSGMLDWSYIESHLPGMAELKEDPEIMANLARLRKFDRRIPRPPGS